MTEEIKAYDVVDEFEKRSPGVPAVQDSPNAVIMMAMQNKYTPELIEKMMDLQAKHEAHEARKLYVSAMAAFKSNPPEIEKDKTVSYKAGGGTTSYSHASLANVANKINSALSRCGLSAAWQTTQDDTNITVTCSITHSAGHSESTSLTAGPDTSGSKNSIQAMGSAISYLQRYTLLALTGLAASDMDTDGVAPPSKEPINDDLILTIETVVTDLIESGKLKDAKDFDVRLNRLFKVKKIDELTSEQGNSLIKKLGAIGK